MVTANTIDGGGACVRVRRGCSAAPGEIIQTLRSPPESDKDRDNHDNSDNVALPMVVSKKLALSQREPAHLLKVDVAGFDEYIIPRAQLCLARRWGFASWSDLCGAEGLPPRQPWAPPAAAP